MKKQAKEEDQIITVHVTGGWVYDVSNLPKDWNYVVDDEDDN